MEHRAARDVQRSDRRRRVGHARTGAGGRREGGLTEPDREGKGTGGEQETDDEQLVEDAGSHCLVLLNDLSLAMLVESTMTPAAGCRGERHRPGGTDVPSNH